MNPEFLQLIQWVFSPSAVPPSGSHCDKRTLLAKTTGQNMPLHRQLRHGNMHLGEIGTWPFIQPCHTHFGLGTHITCIMVEAHCRCTAILVQDLLAKATTSCIILGNHIIRTGLASKFWPFGKGIGRMILSLDLLFQLIGKGEATQTYP